MNGAREYRLKDIMEEFMSRGAEMFVCYNCRGTFLLRNPRFIKRPRYTVMAGYCPHCGSYLEKVVK